MKSPDQPQNKFQHKKSLGQNFLKSPVVPGWMCEAAAIQTGDTVLEIGPGTGALTRELLVRGATVYAVETDHRAVAVLKDIFAKEIKSGQLTVLEADIKDFTPSTVGLREHHYKLVANIPYFLSGWLLRSYLSGSNQPSTLVFLMQKELVDRIARASKASLLALSVKAYGEVKYIKTVRRGHFNPPPKVDSAILAVKNINRHNFIDISEADFFHILHLGLGQKRKQLLSNLSTKYPRSDLEAIFARLKIAPTARGEDLPLPTWLELVNLISH